MADTGNDTAEMVERNISTVESAYAQAIDVADGGLLSLPNPETLRAIRGLRATINGWASRGRNAAAAGTAPGAGGWSGWVAAGQSFISNFPGISVDGVTFSLGEIADTTAAAVGGFVGRASDAAIDVAGNVGNTLKWLGIGTVLVVLGLVALKYGPSRGGA